MDRKLKLERKKRQISKGLKGIASVIYLNDNSIKTLDYLAHFSLVKNTSWGKELRRSVVQAKFLHGLMKGIPSNSAVDKVSWRVKEVKDLGLIWCVPLLDAKEVDIAKSIGTMAELFNSYGFEMPVSLVIAEPDIFLPIVNINFNKLDSEEKERAFALKDEVLERLSHQGVQSYRIGTLGNEKISYPEGKLEVLKRIKAAFDPNGIIAPGRYGINVKKKKNGLFAKELKKSWKKCQAD